MTVALLSDGEFQQLQTWLYQTAGINLPHTKKTSVAGRLFNRLKHYQLTSYGDYLRLIMCANAGLESQIALDLLTANDTCFFREPKHFEFLRENVLPKVKPGGTFRLWSAASSTGEEPFSLAMTLADGLNNIPWEIIGSDINHHSLMTAHAGYYARARVRTIPPAMLAKHCLKGSGCQEDDFLIEPSLRARVHFMQINLTQTLPDIGQFDVIFFRNVMMYFNQETTRNVVAKIPTLLKPGGYLIISQSESLGGVRNTLKQVAPSIYQN